MSAKELHELQRLMDEIEPQLHEAVEKSVTGETLMREHGILTPEEMQTRLD